MDSKKPNKLNFYHTYSMFKQMANGMQISGGNQPLSSSSNHNVSKDKTKLKPPKHNKSIKSRGKGRKTDKKQNTMINKLSKQIYKLQMSQYGKFQMNYHIAERILVPTASQPICFDLTDFSCSRQSTLVPSTVLTGCRIYQVDVLGTSVGQASNFTKDAALAAEIQNNPYWKNLNNDAPDTGAYLASQATYFFEVHGNANLDDTRIRFDIIAQKPGTVNVQQAPVQNAPVVLPFSLIYMKKLVGGTQNRIDPLSFKKYFSKTIYINSQPSGTSGVKATTANTQQFSFKIKPNKICIQNLTNPQATPGTTEIDLGNWGPNNVPFTQPLWCVISTDDTIASVGDQVQIRIARRVSWYDHLGSASKATT